MFFKSRHKRRADRKKSHREERAEDNPRNYEGREHVSYHEPGFTKEEIEYSRDEPKMKSRVSKEEMHEMEDNYHMETPDEATKREHKLPRKILRAHMNMEDSQAPKPMRGNLVREAPKGGLYDTDGKEDYGPKHYQEDSESSPERKERRKKIAVAVIRRRMREKE